ncbi:endo alpha-1,4 polygalactosaminidase [Paenibacillus aceris]|uniref:Glycoside-hydrolase family GH114 TIM-barrel domain-containing protein n=1 Tax=Paenibacillus aceris TaxID=869555 RepID=A0ABS4IA33_9BACL|nr:endo alpha-1,4 polygalactosaminidase [Paenibacillus aceris]MBP1967718.1 hypothetical protein [Paenibacillus aceris]NHW39107.1 hypothetical protein [Paenibacillus aceris]
MGKTWSFTTAIVVSITLFSFLFKQHAQANGPFQHVKNYSLYYGNPTVQAIAKLKTKDLIIIEPQLFTREQIKDIQSKGTLVIGYLSVMETPAWNKLRSKNLQSQDYYWQKGERVHFPQWNSYLMDLRHAHYREVLLAEIQTSIADKGMNGVFLDTVGDIDDYIKEKTAQTQTREAYVTLLQSVSKQYPQLSIIQNRGFETLDYSAALIDAFLWEDWRANWKKDTWMKANVEKLQKEQKKGLTVFSLSLHKESSPGREARKLNFIHMDAPDGYTKKVY